MRICRRTWQHAVVVLFVTLLCAPMASAQTTLGRVTGSVLDSSGAALPGATITLTNEATNQVQTTTSNEIGAYVFPQVTSAATRWK